MKYVRDLLLINPCPVLKSRADSPIEPTELVQYEKDVRMRPDIRAELFHISRPVDLLPRHR